MQTACTEASGVFLHSDWHEGVDWWYRNALWELRAAVQSSHASSYWRIRSLLYCIWAGFKPPCGRIHTLHIQVNKCVSLFVCEEPELSRGGSKKPAALLWRSGRLAAARPQSLRQHLRLRQQGAAETHTCTTVFGMFCSTERVVQTYSSWKHNLNHDL